MKLIIDGIKKRYGKKIVLDGISFQAHEGECIGILGQNGSGKSTLLSILAGIQKPDSGSFLCDGENLLQDKQLRTRMVGYVPQGTPLLNELTALENLKLWYSCAGKDYKYDLKEGVPAILGIPEFLHVPVDQMSGGMKKRLSIACAVAHGPGVLMLDETSAALDFACKEKIYEYLKLFLHRGGIILMVTHDMQELNLCTTYNIIRNGVFCPYDYRGDISALTRELQKED